MMLYIALLISAAGFFMWGFYYCRYKTFMRLKNFIGKGKLDYFIVLQILANDLPKKEKEK
jgi:hypothetical protein